MPTQENKIYLTFDDGPIPGPTEFVLETLKKFNAKATFFCIGDNVRKHPEIFTQVAGLGHSIGNHTFNHLKGWHYSTQDYINNIELCERQIKLPNKEPISGIQPLFRPPYGRITQDQIRSLKDIYKIVMWDVLTQDYSKSITPQKCLAGTMRATRAGSVVVFHDSIKAERNLTYVLPRYLEHFAKQGFVFAAL